MATIKEILERLLIEHRKDKILCKNPKFNQYGLCHLMASLVRKGVFTENDRKRFHNYLSDNVNEAYRQGFSFYAFSISFDSNEREEWLIKNIELKK